MNLTTSDPLSTTTSQTSHTAHLTYNKGPLVQALYQVLPASALRKLPPLGDIPMQYLLIIGQDEGVVPDSIDPKEWKEVEYLHL